MESDTLIPLPNDLIGDCLEVGEGKCDICGKVLTKRGMGRHKAIHARKAPPNPNDEIVAKLRNRLRHRFAELYALSAHWNTPDNSSELRDVARHVIALHADLDVLGVI